MEVDDPYYAKRKTFLACPLACVLELGFGKPVAAYRGDELLPARARRLHEARQRRAARGARRLARLRRRRAARRARAGSRSTAGRSIPGPFYLVWSGPEQDDPHRYPWPYQLAAIEIAPFEARYPHTLPAGEPAGSPAWTGFAVFRAECVACHAINGEGGTIGPELNLPLSIVEYRPAEQIKRFVRDPAQFRYSSMPANPHLDAGAARRADRVLHGHAGPQARSPPRATRAVSTPARRRARRMRNRADSGRRAAARPGRTTSPARSRRSRPRARNSSAT